MRLIIVFQYHLTVLNPKPLTWHYPAVYPPSTIRAVPVTKLESSEARNRAALAISSGSATRPKGICRAKAAMSSSTFRPVACALPGEQQCSCAANPRISTANQSHLFLQFHLFSPRFISFVFLCFCNNHTNYKIKSQPDTPRPYA